MNGPGRRAQRSRIGDEFVGREALLVYTGGIEDVRLVQHGHAGVVGYFYIGQLISATASGECGGEGAARQRACGRCGEAIPEVGQRLVGQLAVARGVEGEGGEGAGLDVKDLPACASMEHWMGKKRAYEDVPQRPCGEGEGDGGRDSLEGVDGHAVEEGRHGVHHEHEGLPHYDQR